jgi:hypothetical protein
VIAQVTFPEFSKCPNQSTFCAGSFHRDTPDFSEIGCAALHRIQVSRKGRNAEFAEAGSGSGQEQQTIVRNISFSSYV